ncbi:MAG: GAF domain-containing protein [Candidatus Marinimicrobia bacterium]|nr:GAF domain-containing protein [Candidatus Neomarinimicrobiota bacterium]
MTDFEDTRWLGKIIQSGNTRDEILLKICQYLKTKITHYNWVGFYIADPEKRVLNLGPYSGAPTEHVCIPFGRGVCGQAAETMATVLVQDVNSESNYLACSLDVKSEIVVPILKNGQFVAELDIDSHQKNSFKDQDQIFLERMGHEIADLF